jgi:hypothetical protein
MKLTLSMKSTLRRWPALSLATGLMGLCLALPDRGMAQSGATAAITVGTLRGTYIYGFTGYTVGSSGNLIAFAVAGRETFFGNGTSTGISTTTTQGQAIQSRVTYTATYTVNADGSVSETDTDEHGVVTHYTDFPLPDGNALSFIETDPGVIASGIETRGPLETH